MRSRAVTLFAGLMQLALSLRQQAAAQSAAMQRITPVPQTASMSQLSFDAQVTVESVADPGASGSGILATMSFQPLALGRAALDLGSPFQRSAWPLDQRDGVRG